MKTEAPRVVAYFNTWSTAHGGSSTSLIDLARALDRERFVPVVVCPGPGELVERLRDEGVSVFIRPMSRWRPDEIWRFVREVPDHVTFLRRHRVAALCGNTSATRRSLMEAARWCGVPYVQHVRNPVRSVEGTFGYRQARRIVTVSDALAAPFRAVPALAAKTVTVHNAVDLSRYDEVDDRRDELGVGSRPVVGYVGQLIRRKGVTTLIAAMAHVVRVLPTAVLAIVGATPPDRREYERECRALVARLGLQAHVQWVGYRRDVPAWMRTFDVVAVPSQSEPFGKVVAEAMAASRVVVASRVGGIPEIVTGRELGRLVEPNSPRALAQELLETLLHREEAIAIGRRAAESVRRRFGLTRMVTELASLYDDVLQAPASRGHLA